MIKSRISENKSTKQKKKIGENIVAEKENEAGRNECNVKRIIIKVRFMNKEEETKKKFHHN